MNKRRLLKEITEASDKLHNGYMNDMDTHYMCKDIVNYAIGTLDLAEAYLSNKCRWARVKYKLKKRLSIK